MKNFIVFMSLFAGKLGAQLLIDIIDSIQQGLFGMVVEKIFIAELQKIAGMYYVTVLNCFWRYLLLCLVG